MNKMYLLIIIGICFCGSVEPHGDLSGIYRSDNGTYLEIDKNSFRLLMPNAAQNGFYSEILAVGSIKQINESFVELNSLETPAIEIAKCIKIIQEKGRFLNDSINIRFSIPYQGGKLKIMIYTNTFKTFELCYSIDNQELSIPNNVKTISLYFVPEYVRPHTYEGLFYGIVGFDSMEEYKIEDQINSMEIQIPAMDDSFFEKYYVKGDYARIMNDSIIWKGEVYKKSKK